MLDLLAAISSVDPPALLAWIVFLFAASGYPLGIMLGSSCSPCCGTPCTLCTEGELPETLTVTFDGLQDQTPGPDLCLLTFSAPYGGGAAGKVTAPGGDPDADKGPITAVSLTNGGSGYAKLGRVAPTITASGGSGTGATFSVSATSANDANGIPSWSVSGVTVTGTTTGYADGDQITFSAAAGDTEEQAAAATINTTRTAPTLSVSAPTGSGATFSISYTANGGSPATWSVSGITVTAGGTGYTDGSALTLSLGSGDKVDSEAYATILTSRLQPTLTASVASDEGTGAALSVSLTQTTDYDGRTVWNVSGITATSGGSDYVVGDLVSVTVTDGQETYYSYFSASVSSVDGGGAITGVTIDYGGEYFKDGGVIQSVAIYDGGTYYKDDGVITGVTVDAGGTYYREDADQDPYVATVTVGVTQTPPSAGSGATLTATVEEDTASANFGKITAVAITSGGTNYLAWEWRNTTCCGDYYNGMSVVVKRLNYGSGDACLYAHSMCGVGNLSNMPGKVEVRYNGPSLPPTISLVSETTSSICNTSFTASESVANCSNWTDGNDQPIEFTATGGATASVSTGGEYDQTFRNPGGSSCYICCKGESLWPSEIEAYVLDTRGEERNATGTYVVAQTFASQSPFINGWLSLSSAPYHNLSVQLNPCSFQTAIGFDGQVSLTNCNTCHKKCIFTVRFAFSPSGNDFYVDRRFCDDVDENGLPLSICPHCEDTPICSPEGKTFELCNTGDCTTCGEITVSF
jgi:hypothetical protein